MSEAFTAEQIARSWAEALAVWDVKVSLSPPLPFDGKAKSKHEQDEPLAYIDLETRQVVVNFAQLAEIKAGGSLTAVIAHEIGHHVRFPHTLAASAGLQVLEKRLIPGLKSSLTNLFFDLLVNEYVGRTRAEELSVVYRGFVAAAKGPLSPLFQFYLSIYEELWGQEPGSLVPPESLAAMEKNYPGSRADARMFVQTFYALPGTYLQFVYFCAMMVRYLEDPSKDLDLVAVWGDMPSPDADDFDSILRGNGQSEAADALREAAARGWLKDSGMSEGEDDPLTTIDKITRHRPGHGQGEFKEALVSKHYKRMVDEHIFKIPGTIPPAEPFLPTVLEDWEWGDNPRGIDWTGSVLKQGPLAGIHPLRRDLDPDQPSPIERELPALEVYLDTSGSMPDPSRALNVMTLAAQILAASTIRKKGTVRGIVYSSGPPLVSGWMYDEETARRFLLNHVGGGTEFPFKLLKKFAEERSDVLRVIISDSDFLSNVTYGGGMEGLKYGISQSQLLVAFLAVDKAAAQKTLAPVLNEPKFRLAVVHGLAEFARAARDLADAILGTLMVFDLKVLKAALQASPLVGPYPFDLAAAIVSDVFRLAEAAPPAAETWKGWATDRDRKRLREQLGMLAHMLVNTGLGEASVERLKEKAVAAPIALNDFFDVVSPLTAEMLATNPFRQEEFLRRWIECLQGTVLGESAGESTKKLQKLDYRTTLLEYERAEKARQAEGKRRAAILAEAAAKAAAASGWRE